MKYEVIDLEVGSNFIEIEFTDDNGSDIEMKFFQTDINLINNCLNTFGFTLTDEGIQDYEY